MNRYLTMPFCPECRYEYVSGVAECPDCRVPLVGALDEEPSEKEAVPEEFVPCWDAKDFVEADAACTVIRGQGIPCRTEKCPPSPYVAYLLHETPSSAYHVIVPESKRSEARELLERVMPKLRLGPLDEMSKPWSDKADD